MIKVKRISDFVRLASANVREARKDAVVKVAKASSAHIREASDVMKAQIRFIPDGFIVGEKFTKEDVGGDKIKQEELKTKAYASLHKRLSTKSEVIRIIGDTNADS
jgi:hypothetical protein